MIAMCGILLYYGLVSNATFLSWSLEDDGVETDVVMEETALLHEISDTMVSSSAASSSSSPNNDMNNGSTGREQAVSENTGLRRVEMADDFTISAKTTRKISLAVSPEAALLFSKETKQSQSPPPFEIFYDVFIRNNQGESGVLRSLSIVKEQMDQVGNSYAGKFGANANQNLKRRRHP
jgi:hypothetical protein